jgi:hypothetical protein
VKYIAIAVWFLCTPLFGSTSYQYFGCIENDCSYFLGNGFIDDHNEFESKKSTSIPSAMVTALVGATGSGISTIKGYVGAMRDGAVNAGYHRISGSISGPSGHISFSWNMVSGEWSLRGGPRDDRPQYPKPPGEN